MLLKKECSDLSWNFRKFMGGPRLAHRTREPGVPPFVETQGPSAAFGLRLTCSG